jgi:SOS-response transcriptional repressor LexA
MNKNKIEIRKKIINFVNTKYRKTRIVPSIKEINKKFGICFQFYFPGGMSELYRVCKFKFSPKQNRKRFLKKWWNDLRDFKRKAIIDFVEKEYKKSGIVPSARKIDNGLNLSFYSCFPEGMNTLYKLCGFEFSPEENKQKSRKDFYLQKRNRIRKEILKYFIQQIKNGITPTATNIRERFSVSLSSYFPRGIRELYKITKTNPPASLRDRKKLQQEIIEYIRSQVKKGFYPTRNEISEKFHTNINGSIRELYNLAGVQYKREPNPFLRYEKEKRLVNIVVKLFPKIGFKIKRVSIGPSKPNGPDIILEDENEQLIPVEIKAFQKFGKVGHAENSPYVGNEISQLKRYIRNLRAPYGYLVTSTDRKTLSTLPSNVKILFGKNLKQLLLKLKMYKEIKNLEWIRNSSISYGKEKIYKKIRDKILRYTNKKFQEGKYVSEREIFRKFKLNPNSYFPGGMREIYKTLGIDAELLPNYRMSRRFDKKKFKKLIIKFVKEENKRGHFPTYKEIQKKFNCLPKLYFPGGIREIARLARIKYSRKFANKTLEEKELIKQKIIQYFAEKIKNGYYPTYRDIRSIFHTDLRYYFKNINEIYQKAGYNGALKKTWKNSGKRINEI